VQLQQVKAVKITTKSFYFAGQLDQIAEEVYDTNLRIRVLQSENTTTAAVSSHLSAAATAAAAAAGLQNVLVKYRLDFDNSAYMDQHAAVHTFDRSLQLPSIPIGLLLRLFPFGVVIDQDIRIMDAGEKLLSVWGASTADEVRGHLLVQHLVLRRPRDIPFTWTNVSTYIYIKYTRTLDSQRRPRAGLVELCNHNGWQN